MFPPRVLARVALTLALIASAAGPAVAEEVGEQVAPGYEKYGLLRERDLTLFGFLRLDMHPANAAWVEPGESSVEVQFGYQNTWSLSSNVEQYLKSLPGGRRQLNQSDVQAIRAMPGEAYLVDLELGLIDITLHHQLTERWSVNGTFSAVRYSGGFLDGAIEGFHRQFGFDTFGRPAVNRNNTNIIFNLKGSQAVYLNSMPDGGVLDPTFGLRYSLSPTPSRWNLVLESAIKVPVDGERNFLSTGNLDVGLQATLQHFGERQAEYASVALVRTQGSALTTYSRTQYIPTYIVGYELSLAQRTSAIAQAYASPSVLTHDDTDLAGLLETKYQVSVGIRHRIGGSVVSFAITENIAHFNNTPDVGFQIGWTYAPATMR